MNKFSKQLFSIIPQNFNPEKYFENYDHFEKFQQDKNYELEPYNFDYTGIIRLYRNVLYLFSNELYEKKINPMWTFVVAEEIPSETELKELIPYCQCTYHQMYSFNPFRLFIDTVKIGCLKSFNLNPSMNVLKKTRKVKELNDNKSF